MDAGKSDPVIPPLAAANPEYPACQDCGKEFTPGHMCPESMAEESERMKTAFQVAILTVYAVRDKTIMWPKDKAGARLKEINKIVKGSIETIDGVLHGPGSIRAILTEEANGKNGT